MKTLLLCCALVFVLGCHTDSPLSSAPPAGAFQYTAFDSTGRAVASGWFTMTVQDSSHITGEWHFAKIGTPSGIGPQTGDGTLSGHISGGMLNIALNPGWADNNVFLYGPLSAGAYRGSWTWISFRGITGRGTFSSLKR